MRLDPRTKTDEDLIDRYIELSPLRPGLDRAYLKDAGIEVWALVAYYLNAGDHDLDRVAQAYAVPRDAIEAALAYYRHHKDVIDARLKLLQSA